MSETAPAPSPRGRRFDEVCAALAGLAVFAALLFEIGPGAYWLDSGELGAAAFELGVAHPPGQPLHALTTKAVALLPAGGVAWRGGLASAFALALAASVFVALALRVARRVWGWSAVVAAPLAGGLVVAASLAYGLAFQGVRVEVYALHLLVAALALACVVAFVEPPAGSRPDGRWPMLAALVLGFGLANHHWLMVLACAPLALLLLGRGGRFLARRLGVLVAALVVGLSTYVYLPVRAERAPVVSWGDAVRAERFAWVVSARAFQKSLRPRASTSLAENALTLGGIAMEAVTPVGLALGLVGLGLLARRRRGLGLALIGALALTLASQLTMPADPHNPDVHGYLMLAVVLLALGAFWLLGALACALGERSPRLAAAVGGALAMALPIVQYAAQAPRWSLRDFEGAEAVARASLRPLPLDAVLVSSYFQSVFLAWHARVVEGERPDVALLDRHFARYPGYAAREGVRAPSLATLAVSLGGRSEEALAVARRFALERPLLFELDLDLPDAIAASPWPTPWHARLGEAGDRLGGGLVERARRGHAWTAAREAVGEGFAEPETRRYFLWKHFVAGSVALRVGAPGLAADEARAGLRLSPESAELRALLGDAERRQPR